VTASVLRPSMRAGVPVDTDGRETWTSRGLSLPALYAAALAVWLVTRWLVLVHQGAWPWMNAFVVAAARGMVVGDWNEAVRPQLPAVLGIPLVLAGANEQQTVAALYVLASLVQFGAFVVLMRSVFPGKLLEQGLGLLFFLVVPYNHSIHHYRDVPVVLASSAVFLLAAHFIAAVRGQPPALGRARMQSSALPRGREGSAAPAAEGRESAVLPGGHGATTTGGPWGVVWVFGAMLLGVWSRTEVLTFVGVLVVLSLVVWRRQAVRLAVTYAAAAVVVSGSLLLVYRLEGVDPAEASRYQFHTFLDSTPESWLTPGCRADPTENCRADDGLLYFGPADPRGGVLPMVVGHPLTTVVKTVRSAWDNLWILLGPNLSTFPGVVPFLVVALAVARPARQVLSQLPIGVWLAMVAVVAETVLPPLSWAPPHPQYHLQLVLPIVALVVPVLVGLARMPRGRLLVLAFFVGNAGLSAFRYTRYPGY